MLNPFFSFIITLVPGPNRVPFGAGPDRTVPLHEPAVAWPGRPFPARACAVSAPAAAHLQSGLPTVLQKENSAVLL